MSTKGNPMTKTLVERLREQFNYERECYPPPNPLLWDAASRIEGLERALELIAGQSPLPSNSPDKSHEHYLRMVLLDLARQALSDKGLVMSSD